VKANSQQNQDLFFALKGGGNQFGIVTRFTMDAFPMGKTWGGYRIFGSKHAPEVFAAVQKLTDTYPDRKAAVIVTIDRLVDREMFIIFFFYDGETPPPGVFCGLEDIKPFHSNTKTRSYANLVSCTPN
jgi:hypothetical protein